MSRMIFSLFLCLAAAQALAADGKVTYSAEQLVGLMDDAELKYYYDTFDYVMEKVHPGQSFPWKTYASHGEIAPDSPITGKGTVCRNFHEVINVKNQHQAVFDGIGCKRVGSDGWCKLRRNDLQSCALEPPRNFIDRTGRDADDALQGVNRKAAGWWPF